MVTLVRWRHRKKALPLMVVTLLGMLNVLPVFP